MRQAVIYLRVSTIEQTTANQERELREIASRMGCEIVKVYRDHGISGAKGRDRRPAFDKLCRDAARREFDIVMAWSVDRLGQPAGFGRLPVRAARTQDRSIPAPTGARHHDACRQGDVSDDGRICRVRARHDSGTRPRRACASEERGEASWSASDSSCAGETNP
jgi:hypothetical protein